MRSKTECIAWSVGMGNTMYTQWNQRTVGRAELKISERPLFPEDLQPTRHRSRPTAPRLRQTRPRARDCPSSSEDGVIGVIDAGLVTSRSVSPLVSPVPLSSGTSDEEEVVARRNGRRTAGYNSNIRREPRACRYPRVGHCSKCNARVRVDECGMVIKTCSCDCN